MCGTDFSETAALAATAAAALAARSGIPLVLVHAADEFDARGDDRKALGLLLKPLETKLRIEADRLRQAGAAVEEKLVTGTLAERAISELAKRKPWRIAPMPASSNSGWKRRPT